MIKKGRKGRISNELVAASCAAILAVYAAGNWRTRDEARRFAAEGQTRRPVRPVPMPAASTPAAVVALVANPEPPVPQAEFESLPVATKSLKPASAPAPSPPPAALPQLSEPAPPAVAQIAVEEKSEPAVEAAVVADHADPAVPAHKPWLDGYYTGWGQSRHGDIQAFVTIEGGRIVNAGIANCETRYPCSVISHIILQPIDLQGPDVDAVSRATESADAYYTGLVRALENAETGTFRAPRP